MNDCYFAKKDWRECKSEVSGSPSYKTFYGILYTRYAPIWSSCHHLYPYNLSLSIHASSTLLKLAADGSFPRMLEAEWQRPTDRDQGRMICNEWRPNLSFYEIISLAHPMYNIISSLSCPTRIQCTSSSSHSTPSRVIT